MYQNLLYYGNIFQDNIDIGYKFIFIEILQNLTWMFLTWSHFHIL